MYVIVIKQNERKSPIMTMEDACVKYNITEKGILDCIETGKNWHGVFFDEAIVNWR